MGAGRIALSVALAAAPAGPPATVRGAFTEPVRVLCPANQTTTVVFPEPLRQLRGQGSETASLGLTIERTKPRGVVTVRPRIHPASATIEFRGPTLLIRIVFETAGEGIGTEVRLDTDGPPGNRVPGVEEEPAAASFPEAGEPAPPPAEGSGNGEAGRPAPVLAVPGTATDGVRTPTPSSAASASGGLDLAGILNARPVSIGRREGLPGQRPMILVDALHGELWTWLRFRLEDGAESRIERVWWEHGDVASYVQEPTGEDLRVVVQIPRALLNKRTRVSLRVESGPVYKFALTPSTLTSFIKGVFQ